MPKVQETNINAYYADLAKAEQDLVALKSKIDSLKQTIAEKESVNEDQIVTPPPSSTSSAQEQTVEASVPVRIKSKSKSKSKRAEK